MIFLLLLLGFGFVLYKMCKDKGITPWGYLTGFVTGFFLILFATSAAIIFVYGQNIINDPDMNKKVMMFSPFAIMFHFLLFIFFRQRISHAPVHKDDDEHHFPPTVNGKKDLSYFR